MASSSSIAADGTVPRLRIDRTVAAIAFAVGAFGISFGVLARAVGLDALQVIAMSLIAFAGSAQFAAVAALDGGGSAISAALSGVALNLRYLPMGVVVGPALRGGPARRAAKAHLVVDEAVAVSSGADGRVDEARFILTGGSLYAAWVGGTAIGALGGSLLGDPETLGLDAAFPALFLALIAPRLREESGARRAALAGTALAVVGVVLLPVGLATVLAAVGALAALGATGPVHVPELREEAGP
jgi:4-azaleucine resistance transporter AzlC